MIERTAFQGMQKFFFDFKILFSKGGGAGRYRIWNTEYKH